MDVPLLPPATTILSSVAMQFMFVFIIGFDEEDVDDTDDEEDVEVEEAATVVDDDEEVLDDVDVEHVTPF